MPGAVELEVLVADHQNKPDIGASIVRNYFQADADPGSVAVGDRVEMTFRRMATARGIHNYFWKARPVPEAKRS